ncbi:MAG: protein kinase, partial [Leptolyngbya sp.]|nr:protein kinase [Candidatus Melainabacteria bacterium]
FVMDLVEGETLSEAISKNGTLPVSEALKIFIQVGFALAYAHQNGVIHRDIKPSNIMLIKQTNTTVSSAVKVVDFGLAKLTGADEFNQQTLTKTGEIFGSPLYMSPEQCLGIAVDHRSDLYSFGCVMYEVLTGAPPLIGESALSTMMKHQSEKPLSMKEASLGSSFPLKLEEIIFSLLEKDPKKRFQDAGTLTAELAYLEQEVRAQGDGAYDNITSKISEKLQPLQQPGIVRNNLAVAIVAAVAGLMAGAFATYSMMLEKVQNAESESARIRREFATDPTPKFLRSVEGSKTEANTAIAAQSVRQKFFSTIIPGTRSREFNFPAKDIGVVFIPPNFQRTAKDLIVINNFRPLYFKSNAQLWLHPEYLDRFRDDELLSIELSKIDTNLKPLLEKLPRFKNLERLTITDTEFGDADLKYLEILPKLRAMNLRSTEVSGEAISRMKTIKNFTDINLDATPSAKIFIKNMKSLPKLTHLSVPRSRLNNQDIQRISAYKNVHTLDLTRNIEVNDDAMPMIASMPNIKDLVLNSTGITSKSIPIFLKMPKLKHMQLRHWEKKDRDILREHHIDIPEEKNKLELEYEYLREKPDSMKKSEK